MELKAQRGESAADPAAGPRLGSFFRPDGKNDPDCLQKESRTDGARGQGHPSDMDLAEAIPTDPEAPELVLP